MRSTIILILLTISTLWSQNVKIEDYQVPISRAKYLRVNGNWNWNQSGDSVINNIANAQLIYRQFYSSLPFAWFFDSDLNGNKNFKKYEHNIKITSSVRNIFGMKRIFCF